MKNNLIFIGPLDLGVLPGYGDTMKNNLLLKRLSQVFGQVYVVDTYNWQSHPFVLVKMFMCLFFVRNAKVVVSCEVSAAKILTFLYFIRLQNDVYYSVIGSGFPRRIKNGEYSVRRFSYLKKIIVESLWMLQDLEKAGLKNVVCVPNFKPIFNIPLLEHNAGHLRFVFLSRIIREKGIDLIFNCVKRLNESGFGDKYSVTFYGVEPEDYDEFFDDVNRYANVDYRGLLDLTKPEGYEELSSFDVMLFPTYHEGEGHPGAVIDAFIAGIPIIASDWHSNKSLIADGETGFIIPAKDENALYEAMINVLNNVDILTPMRFACQREAHKYDVDSVLSKDSLCNLGLLCCQS